MSIPVTCQCRKCSGEQCIMAPASGTNGKPLVSWRLGGFFTIAPSGSPMCSLCTSMIRPTQTTEIKFAPNQRGIALVWAMITLFAVMSVTAVMTAMAIYETKKSHRFQDERQNHYALDAGIHETRQRLSTNAPDSIAAQIPSVAPTEDDGVIYVINPGPGEMIQPWTADNPFADRELCKEITCSGQFAHGSHYQLAMASPSFAFPGVHLSWKWIRIIRKVDQGPFAVSGTPNNAQVCWNGQHESTQVSACNPVFELTGFAQTISGSREMIHMDVAMHQFAVPAAVTLLNGGGQLTRADLPAFLNQPTNNLMLNGTDSNQCCPGPMTPEQKAAIAVEDAAALDAINQAFQPTSNFIGGFMVETSLTNQLSDSGYAMNSVMGLEDLRMSVERIPGAQHLSDCSAANFGDSTHYQVIVAQNCILGPQNQPGYGLLWVTGTLDMQIISAMQSWNGIVVVAGQGICKQTAGFETQITGALICAQTRDISGALLASLGKPTFTWTAARPGMNEVGVQYDSCQIMAAGRLLFGFLPYEELSRRNIKREWI